MPLLKHIKVAIIDDNDMVRNVLKTLLSSYTKAAFEIVLELYSLQNFEEKKLSSNKEPDIILLDINMAGITGLRGIPLLYRSFLDSLIIILTEVDDRDTVMKCTQVGARVYITKGVSQ